jgi:hypothetical protein
MRAVANFRCWRKAAGHRDVRSWHDDVIMGLLDREFR